MTDRLEEIKRYTYPEDCPDAVAWLIAEVERLREILVEIREIILRGGK